jgi:FMN-dependent NADH-azoreductase
MTRILRIDASPRPGRAGTDPHGSLTRRLTHLFISNWKRLRPDDEVVLRDVGLAPPKIVGREWIEAAFATPDRHQPWMDAALAESDALVEEVLAADVLLIGVPLYNFGMPANLKAWIDNIVRLDRTVAYDPTQPDDPYRPLMLDRPRQAVVLSSRGGHGFDPGGVMAHMNHLEPALRTVLSFIGVPEMHSIAIEHQEDGGELLANSIQSAEARVVELVDRLTQALDAAESEIAPEVRMAS